MGIKRLSARYADVLLYWMHLKLLSISIKKVQKNTKRESCFWNFNFKFCVNCIFTFQILGDFRGCVWEKIGWDRLNLYLYLKSVAVWIKKVWENANCEGCFWTFDSKIELSIFINFNLSDIYGVLYYRNKNEISSVYHFTEYP